MNLLFLEVFMTTLASCIKFPLLWLFLFAHLCADTTIVPYDENNKYLEETHPHVAVPQTSFTDLVWVLIKTLLIIGAFVGFLYGAIWLFRRLSERRFESREEGEDIQILERAFLSNKSAIYLLQVKDKYVLIGESHNGLTRLGTFPSE